MNVEKDFADLCSLFNEKSVDYLIVGGYAVAFHGAPRFTGDLDILVRPDAEQVRTVLEAVSTFGFPAQNLQAAYILENHKILQMGHVPVQVHLMTDISGVSWDRAWQSREKGTYGDVPVFFIGREALIENKRASGRTKDLADVEALGRPHRE
jgi:hypothetical protein